MNSKLNDEFYSSYSFISLYIFSHLTPLTERDLKNIEFPPLSINSIRADILFSRSLGLFRLQ